MIPDIDKARNLLIGGKWTSVISAEELETGWIKLLIPGGLSVNVRTGAIEAVKYLEAAEQQRRPDFAFDLGRS